MSSSVGSIALGIVGAVVLGVISGGTLAGVGFALGSAIGGAIFAPDGPNIEGPRIGDTDVQASTLGRTLTQHYGVTRSGGNVIWSAGLKETKTVEKQGGKGGAGGSASTQTSYAYSASFATAFGIGPATKLLKLYADGKLIYDVTGNGSVQNSKYRFTFRPGTSGQAIIPLIAESINRRLQGLPDVNAGSGQQSEYKRMVDLISDASVAANAGDKRAAIYRDYLTALNSEAAAGGGTPRDYQFTPAYRNICYIIFSDMPLADFGNRIPNITAEIAWGDVASTPPEIGNPTQQGVTQSSPVVTQPTSGTGVITGSQRMVVQSGTTLRRFSLSSSAETQNRVNTQVPKIFCSDASGNLIVRYEGNPQSVLAKVSSGSLNLTGTSTSGDGGGPHTMPSAAVDIQYAASAGTNAGTNVVFGVGSGGRGYVYRTDGQVIQVVAGIISAGEGGSGQTISLGGSGPLATGSRGQVWALVTVGTTWRLVRVNIPFGRAGEGDGFFIQNVTANTIASGSLGTDTVASIVYDSSGSAVYAMFQTATGGTRVRKYDLAGNLRWNVTTAVGAPQPTSGFQFSSVTDGQMGWGSGADLVLMNLSDGNSQVFSNVVTGGTATENVQIYIGSRAGLFTWVGTQPTQFLFGRVQNATFESLSKLKDVVANICARTGMAADEYDVASIPDSVILRGYTISRPSTGRGVLEKLLMGFFLEGIESDYAVKFLPKRTTPIRSITERELGSVTSPTGPIQFLETREPEYNLPKEVNIAYFDPLRDYQQNNAHYQRVSNPVQTMYSSRIENIELPIVYRESEANSVAQRLLFLSWLSRDRGKARLAWKHADLDPGDVVSVTFDNGRTLTDRIDKITMGANFELELNTQRAGDPVYTPGASLGLDTNTVPSNGIVTPVFSEAFILDIPLLADFQDLGRTGQRYYAVVGSDTPLWRSAALYESPDNSQFGFIDSATVDPSWGECQEVLPTPRVMWSLDRSATLTVRLSVDNGDVTSTTYAELINNNANRAIIWNPSTGIGEIIQFQDVTVNSDGTVTLSNLIRGLRGTDYAADQHVSGEYFILLTDAAILPQTNELANIGSTEYFKAVSAGGLLASTPSTSVTWVGRDLRPYAPSRLSRALNGADIDVTWNRRARLGGEWNMNTNIENLPLYEDSEAYTFWLLPNTAQAVGLFDETDATTFAFQRTTTTPSYKITAAELSDAGYTTTTPFINVAVAQVSAQVGNGFIRKAGLAL